MQMRGMTQAPLPIKGKGAWVYGVLDGRRGAARGYSGEPGARCAARWSVVRRGGLGWGECAWETSSVKPWFDTFPSRGRFSLSKKVSAENVQGVYCAAGAGLVPDGHLIRRLRAPASRSAPNQPFRLFRCSGRLILHKQSTGLFIPKHSTCRASPLRVNPQGEAKGCKLLLTAKRVT